SHRLRNEAMLFKRRLHVQGCHVNCRTASENNVLEVSLIVVESVYLAFNNRYVLLAQCGHLRGCQCGLPVSEKGEIACPIRNEDRERKPRFTISQDTGP